VSETVKLPLINTIHKTGAISVVKMIADQVF